MLFVILSIVLIIGLVINKFMNDDASFSSIEYRENMKISNSSYTVDNVMKYLRQEGFCPVIAPNDSKFIRFKYQTKNMSLVILDNFYRVSCLWRISRDDVNAEAMYVAAMKVMDEYRYIRVIYTGDYFEFAVDQMIASQNQFEKVFAISLELISKAEFLHQQEYNNLTGSIDEQEPPRRNDIYLPMFRWLPNVVFAAVTKGDLAPEALTDEEWLRREIQSRVTDVNIFRGWSSFKINRVDNYGDYKLIIYQFPEPKIVPEAKYGAVLLNTKTLEIDYYTLEMTYNDKWVYGSMSSECHNNYGEVNTPDLNQFVEWIFTKDKQIMACYNYTAEQRSIA